MKKIFTKIAALAMLTAATGTAGFAQTNLGADCGCPAVSARPTVLVSTLALTGATDDGRLIATNTIFDCSKTWVLDKKIYVPNGKSLTIAPGTVVKAVDTITVAANAVALVVERGGKIFANGTATCPIVFTPNSDPMDGTYAISNKGKWGGLLIAGKASNNLTLAANGPFNATGNGRLAVANGLGTFEGFASTNSRDQFGADLTAGETFDDNDNSGVLRYVSIRHSGAILVQGGEINGLTLGSVGRGTTIDHIEIVSCADDNIEFFGGTVNVKHATMLFGNDDMLDWDLGYSGKIQFALGVKSADTLTAADADNGFEMDADDQKSNNLQRSHPIVYNVTMIGNAKTTLSSDNSGLSAIEAKEYTEGEIYNSVFANFRYGLNLIKTPGTRVGGFEAYHNWANSGGNNTNSLKIKCNAFVACTQNFALDKNAALGFGSSTDTAQFYTTDGNISYASVPGLTTVWSMNSTTNAVATKFDAIPNPQLNVSGNGCALAPADGFFTPVSYKGAFASTGKNWMSDWAYTQLLNVTSGLQPCPTDINGDGVTNNVDFLQLLGQFNQSCN